MYPKLVFFYHAGHLISQELIWHDSTYIGDGIREAGIADPEPTTRGNTIGLVLEFLWTVLKEVPETVYVYKLISDCVRTQYKSPFPNTME